MHDFGVTSTRVVFLDLPVVFDLDLAVSGRSVPYRWMPDAGARIGVASRREGAADVRWTTIDPVYVFHVLNCFDDGDTVVMDVVRYDRAFDTEPGEPVASGLPSLARWRIDPVAGRVSEQRLDDTAVEFPRIDPAVAGLAHRYGYCVRLTDRPEDPTPRGLVKYDLDRDEATRFEPGAHRFPGEPVFVRAADGRGEDEGWVLTLVDDAATGRSDLVVLDATSFAGPPVATVHLPARVPQGFHGSWVPTGT
jgi:carotenoid cleavage dioxygenase